MKDACEAQPALCVSIPIGNHLKHYQAAEVRGLKHEGSGGKKGKGGKKGNFMPLPHLEGDVFASVCLSWP